MMSEVEDKVDVTQDACVQTERIVSDEEKALLDKVETL